jgi:Co/Zn/Cd efflux system component
MTLKFMEVPWLVPVVAIVLSMMIAVWTRQWLRNKARARLKMSGD